MSQKKKEMGFVLFTNDSLFKETLGNPNNISYLEDFLECYFDLNSGSLCNLLNVQYEKQLEKTWYYDKAIRADLMVTINNEIKVNMEMYSSFDEYDYKKSEYYVMRINSTQLSKSDEYKNLKKITQINFIDNPSKSVKFMITDEIKHTYKFSDLSNTEMDIVRLDLARKIDYTESSRFIKWLKYFAAKTSVERKKIAKGDKVIMEFDKHVEDYLKKEQIEIDDWWIRKTEFSHGQTAKQDEIIYNMLSKGATDQQILDYTGISAGVLEIYKKDYEEEKI